MQVISLDPLLLISVIILAFVFLACVFLDNMFRKNSSRKRGKHQIGNRILDMEPEALHWTRTTFRAVTVAGDTRVTILKRWEVTTPGRAYQEIGVAIDLLLEEQRTRKQVLATLTAVEQSQALSRLAQTIENGTTESMRLSGSEHHSLWQRENYILPKR